jgi:SAM-dependent methyltransferase
MTTGDPKSLWRVRPDSADYLVTAAAEAEYWARPHPCGLEGMEDRREPPGPSDRHRNACYTGDPEREWQDTVRDYGRFERGLVLGTSMLKVEREILATNPSLHLTFLDISPGTLARRADVLGGRYPGRVATQVGDLNFVELPRERYDVILSSSCLHHVTNLEYLAFQINSSLRPGGFFFLDDYVGEPRFQFAPEKRRVFELLYRRDLARQAPRNPELIWLDPSDLSPFCGVRSNETLDVLARFLTPVHVRPTATLLVPLMRSRPVGVVPTPLQRLRGRVWAAWNALSGLGPPRMAIGTAFLEDLLLVGDVLCEAGLLAPGTAFGVYRKR